MKKSQGVNVVSEGFTEEGIIKSDNRVKKRLLHPHHQARHRLVFWVSSVLIGTVHLVLAVVIIPIFIVINMALLGLALALVALMAGLFYTFSLSRVQHLRTHHHITAGIILPVAVAVYVAFLVFLAQQTFGMGVVMKEIVVMGAVTGVMFSMPYVIHRVSVRKEEDL